VVAEMVAITHVLCLIYSYLVVYDL
jgi:hypothetical protein